MVRLCLISCNLSSLTPLPLAFFFKSSSSAAIVTKAGTATNASFQATYLSLTGKPWLEKYDDVIKISLELTHLQQVIRDRNHRGTSGRGIKTEEIRQWVTKERFFPSIATGRGRPSLHDMEMLRLPKDHLTPAQKRTFAVWMEAHKPTKNSL